MNQLIIIIHQRVDIHNTYGTLWNYALDSGYHLSRLSILQLSYLDYFDKNVLDIKSQVRTTVLFNESSVDINNPNYYTPKQIDINRTFLQDSAFLGNIPLWMVTHSPYSEIKQLLPKTPIPLWIPNITLLKFWINHKKKFPLNIHSTDKLQEYYDLIQQINDNDDILKLVYDGILPDYINNKNNAEIFAWTKFSVNDDDENWHLSEKNMMDTFNRLLPSAHVAYYTY